MYLENPATKSRTTWPRQGHSFSEAGMDKKKRARYSEDTKESYRTKIQRQRMTCTISHSISMSE